MMLASRAQTTAVRRCCPLAATSSSASSVSRPFSALSFFASDEEELPIVEYPERYLKAPVTDLTTKLGGGLRVASETRTGSLTATVGLYFESGSRFETEETSGSSNLLSRLVAKSGGSLRDKIETAGGRITSYTSREQTAILVKVLKDDVQTALEFLSDATTNVPYDCLEEEKSSVIGELRETSLHRQEDLVLDHLHASAYQGTPLSKSVSGTEESVSSLTQTKIEAFDEARKSGFGYGFSPVVVGAGAVEHDQFCDWAETCFGGLVKAGNGGGGSPSTNGAFTTEPAVFTGSDYRVKYNSESVGHLAIAFPTFGGYDSPYAFPLMVAKECLGSFDRSWNLGKNAVTNLASDFAVNELCYKMEAFDLQYKETGLFGVHAVCPDNKVDDVAWYVMNNLVRLVHSVGDDEIARAKMALRSKLLEDWNGNDNVCEDIGTSVLRHDRGTGRLTQAEMHARIESVQTDDVKAAAKEFFNDKDPVIAAVGGIHELPDYTWFRRHSYWLRY